MYKYGLLSKIRRKRFFHCGEQIRTYPNLLNRSFHADKPNQKWVTDISYIPTSQGTLYPVSYTHLDVYKRQRAHVVNRAYR